MNKTRSENIKLGAFVLLGTACLIIAVYLLGAKQNLFGNNMELSAVFQNVNGLQPGNNVRFSGITVGTVKEIEMENDTLIRVHMTIKEEMMEHIRKDAIATIGSDGLVGSMLVNITPGKGGASLVVTGDELRSYSRIATEDMLNTLSSSNDNVAIISENLVSITKALSKGEGVLGHLLNDSLMGDDLSEIMTNLKTSSRSLTATLNSLNQDLSAIHEEGNPLAVLLHDSVSGRLLQQSIANLEKASSSIQVMGQDLELVIARIEQGNGTLEFLATDTSFVRQLDSTMVNLKKGSLLLNQDLEALQHNFLFRRYFKKQRKADQ